MSDYNRAPQPRATPVRHRQGRHTGRPGMQKAYASENDAGMFDVAQNRRVPQTPEKGRASSPVPEHSQSAQVGSQNRSKNKNKGKKPQASPDGYQDHSTPPQRRASMKAVAGPAFAGATFHASPAPSALPMPSFLSKSTHESPLPRIVRDLADRHSPVTDSEVPTATFSSSLPRNHESPLDFMFRAHKQEQEKKTRDLTGSRNVQTNWEPSIFHSQSNVPKSAHAMNNDHRQFSTASGKRNMTDERANGNMEFEIGPAFSTPYHERINAARANRIDIDAPPSGPQLSGSGSLPQHSDPTEALKQYLFGASSGSMEPRAHHVANPQPSISPQQGHHQPHSPEHNDSRSANILTMENNLRRLLKLDLTTESSSSR